MKHTLLPLWREPFGVMAFLRLLRPCLAARKGQAMLFFFTAPDALLESVPSLSESECLCSIQHGSLRADFIDSKQSLPLWVSAISGFGIILFSGNKNDHPVFTTAKITCRATGSHVIHNNYIRLYQNHKNQQQYNVVSSL